MIDFGNEIHLMWIGGALAVLGFIATLLVSICKSFIDKKIKEALKETEDKIEELNKDIFQTNKTMVAYAAEMLTQVSQLRVLKNDD